MSRAARAPRRRSPRRCRPYRCSAAGAQVGGRVRERRSGAGPFEVGRRAPADQIRDLRARRAASGGGAAGWGRGVAYERDLAACVGEIRRTGRVGRGKRRAHGCRGCHLHEIEAPGLDRSRERCRLPRRSTRRRVLNGPAADVDRGGAPVEEFDVVVRVRRARVATSRVDLADDDVRGGAVRGRRDKQRRREDRENEAGQESRHGRLQSEEGCVSRQENGATSCAEVSFRDWHALDSFRCDSRYSFAGTVRANDAPRRTHFESRRCARTSAAAIRGHPRSSRPPISMTRAFVVSRHTPARAGPTRSRSPPRPLVATSVVAGQEGEPAEHLPSVRSASLRRRPVRSPAPQALAIT